MGRSEKARHGGGCPFPVLGLHLDLLPAKLAQGIELGTAASLGGAPFRLDPFPLVKPEQRGIDGSLVHGQRVAAHLFNPPRNCISVQRSHRLERLEDHEVKRPLQNVGFARSHCFSLLPFCIYSAPCIGRMSTGCSFKQTFLLRSEAEECRSAFFLREGQ
jgi:hypothetical protein